MSATPPPLPKQVSHVTAPKDRVPLGSKLAYGAGAFADNTMQNGINNMANQVYNISLGVDPSLISTGLAVPRLWDALIDPFVGNLSDNCRGRWGRRRPFMVGGAIATGLCFAAIWMVPFGWSQGAYFAFFLGVLFLYSTGYAMFSVPFMALGLELTPDYHERTRVLSYRTFFAAASGISIQWMFWLTQRSWFENTVHGMYYVGATVGVVIMGLGLLPAFVVPERMGAIAAKQERAPFWRSLREALGNVAFRRVLYALVAMVFGLFTVQGLGIYVNIYHVFGGNLKAASTLQGLQGTAYQVAAMISIPVVAHLSTRFGKRRTLLGCLILPFIGTLLKWPCFTPANPYLQLIPVILMAPGVASLWTLLGSMVADVCDVDELNHGTRREGVFGAVFFWAFKIGFSLAFFLSGFVLVWSGFDAALGPRQAPEAIATMRVLFTVLPAASILVALWCVSRFPINEGAAYATRTALEQRRGGVNA